ncbi:MULTISPECIES: asparagine synthase-related protein [unclassified Microcoleus]|uniref:asparagine synthetase B family protein n=1 Tax=unclassified Microcoleus TaxID=2642155 RepID=UPI0025FC0C48|nr:MULTISPECIES: asparagine synthase-related protein [unclassified Microcoleus]
MNNIKSLLNYKSSQKQKISVPPSPLVEFASSWRIAWGKIDAIADDAAWRDGQIAIICSNPSVQLILSPSQKFVIVGDIWLSNRSQLLEKLGISASSWQGCDRQLVAQLWERWGVECLPLLAGMFAFAVWDRQSQVLRLARDRTGARTLYYTNVGATRWIAPQLRAIAKYHSRAIDLTALRDYLCCSFVPGDRTLWQQVRELRPGCVLSFPDETISAYWELREQVVEAEQSLEWHGARLRTILDEIVREYLPANQPVGVFLSGGLDSSCIAALAAQFCDRPIHSYSIHFGEECANELEFSSLVAEHCQTEHHILEISFRDMWEKLPETMGYLDDPIGDPLTVPNLLLGRMARESVEVILNGEGGDPCFGGPKNQPMLMNSLYNSVTNLDALPAYLLSFQKCAADLPQLLKPEIWAAMQAEPSVFSADLNASGNYLNRLMALNIKFKGADQILTKVNNLTQAAGLHGRSPLFDQRIVDLSMTIPPEYKLSGVVEKAVLKQAVADLLPAQILDRPKSGMLVPVQLGFKKFWQREAKGLLLSKKAAIAPYFNQSLIGQWLDYEGDTWGRYGVKLWLLVSLELWLQGNK